jgi:hypothetical protein
LYATALVLRSATPTLSLPRDNGLFRTFGAAYGGLGANARQNRQNSSAEQGEPGTSVHLAFNGLQTIDLPLDLAAAPFGFRRGDDGAEVAAESPGESDQRPDSALGRMSDPLPHAFSLTLLERISELDGQHVYVGKARILLDQSLKQLVFCRGAVVRSLAQQGGCLFRC